MLEGLRGEASIAELRRREGIASSTYMASRKRSWKPARDGLPATRRAPPPLPVGAKGNVKGAYGQTAS